jgi:hypothetical protein
MLLLLLKSTQLTFFSLSLQYFKFQRQLEFGLGYSDMNGSFSSIDWQNFVHWCMVLVCRWDDRRDVADHRVEVTVKQ